MKIAIIGTGAANARMMAGDRQAPITDKVDASATLQGDRGRAWLCDLAEGRKRIGARADQDATLAHWVIEAPWAHPFWHSYSLVLVHLRPMADGRKTLIYLDDATHEIWLYAVNPGCDRREMIATGMVNGEWLEPKNFAAQFIEISDELAQERVKSAIQLICDGKLSPDTDYVRRWAQLFGDNMLKDRADQRPPRERSYQQ